MTNALLRPRLVVEIQITPGVKPNGFNSDLDHAAVEDPTCQDCPPGYAFGAPAFLKGLSISLTYPLATAGGHHG